MGFYTKTIYKKDTKGKIRFLTLTSYNGEILQKSGLLDGKATERSKMAKAKNVGRSNETTPDEQAEKEVRAKLIEKLREGYFDTKEQAESEIVVEPMLAQKYEDRESEIQLPCFVQPKLDGMRCIHDGITPKSRKNVTIENIDHIAVFNKLSTLNEHIVTDGELYVHGESFQTNMAYIKKYRKDKTERIQYWIYDVIMPAPFATRNQYAQLIAQHSENTKVVPTYKVNSIEEINNFHKEFISKGFEGTMVRWSNTEYEMKRSKHLLKKKDFIDEAYKIVDVVPSDADPTHGVIECTSDKGIFRCGMKASHEERQEYLTNKHEYIGKTAEIRFFEYTDDGLPRFPVFYGLRLDK